MLSLQGPASRAILQGLIGAGRCRSPSRTPSAGYPSKGAMSSSRGRGIPGSRSVFELFLASADAPRLWDLFLVKGATPVGLGARDTLRLEAGLPLYGHELGKDPAGAEIPIFACPLARFAVSFSPLKAPSSEGALARQFAAYKKIKDEDYGSLADLPRIIVPFALRGRGIARAGFQGFSAMGTRPVS